MYSTTPIYGNSPTSQGIGAGALMSLPMAIMGDMLAPRERAKYQGCFLAVFGISSVLGPLLAFVLALFFKTPPLRAASGLQENAQGNKQTEDAADLQAEVAERDVLDVLDKRSGSTFRKSS